MECTFYTLEVGQGDSHLIICENEIVVIDAGPRDSATLDFLLGLREDFCISALVLTHNDSDHCTGALGILSSLGERRIIRKLMSLQDRPANAGSKAFNRLFALAMELEDSNLLAIERLERSRDVPQTIHVFSDGSRLELIFPTQSDNFRAQAKGVPNSTSGVLRCVDADGVGRGLWCGDLSAHEWGVLLGREDNCLADWFVVPHHGSDAGWSVDTMELVIERVKPRWMIFSVGTANGFGHPGVNWMNLACRREIGVACTQITSRCHSEVDSLGGSVLNRDHIFPRPVAGVACAGTIVYRCKDNEVLRYDQHQARVKQLFGPLCQ